MTLHTLQTFILLLGFLFTPMNAQSAIDAKPSAKEAADLQKKLIANLHEQLRVNSEKSKQESASCQNFFTEAKSLTRLPWRGDSVLSLAEINRALVLLEKMPAESSAYRSAEFALYQLLQAGENLKMVPEIHSCPLFDRHEFMQSILLAMDAHRVRKPLRARFVRAVLNSVENNLEDNFAPIVLSLELSQIKNLIKYNFIEVSDALFVALTQMEEQHALSTAQELAYLGSSFKVLDLKVAEDRKLRLQSMEQARAASISLGAYVSRIQRSLP